VEEDDEQTDGGLLEVRSKELVQRRLRSGCRTSDKIRLEPKIDKGKIMSEYRQHRGDDRQRRSRN